METWAEQYHMKKPRVTTESVDKVRFTSKMSIKEDSVVLIIRLRLEIKEINTVYTVTGSEDISRMTLGNATIGQLDGWRGETHPSHHDSTSFQDPHDSRDRRHPQRRPQG